MVCRVPRPEVAIDEEGKLEITVYSIDPDRGLWIEAAVSAALASPGAETAER